MVRIRNLKYVSFVQFCVKILGKENPSCSRGEVAGVICGKCKLKIGDESIKPKF